MMQLGGTIASDDCCRNMSPSSLVCGLKSCRCRFMARQMAWKKERSDV